MCDSCSHDFMLILIPCINEESTIVLTLFLIDPLPTDWPDHVRFHLLKRFTQTISGTSKQRYSKSPCN